jgi:hypothetical protein
MNLNTTLPAAIGAALAGGFFAGLVNVDGTTFALVVAPKDGGECKRAWGDPTKFPPYATSYCDGVKNTADMAATGSELGQWARALTLAGHTDWYIPSRDELELMYRNLKPTSRDNYASFRDGENPSSVPAGYGYIASAPAQSSVAAFQAGGAEALEPEWYWSSTQRASEPSFAWYQYFSNGSQYGYRKSYEGRARAVRRFAI